MITGFLARAQARAYSDIADNIRAQKEVLDAETARRESTIKLLRKTGELLDIDDLLAADRAQRKVDRASQHADIAAQYEHLDYQREERAHQAELTKLRRERELKLAQQAIIDTDRGLFNAKQGLENQERLKQINFEIWEKRHQALDAKAEHIRNLLREDLEGKPVAAPGGGLPEQLESLHAMLANQIDELTADGLTEQSEIYRGLVAELGQILQVMRGK